MLHFSVYFVRYYVCIYLKQSFTRNFSRYYTQIKINKLYAQTLRRPNTETHLSARRKHTRPKSPRYGRLLKYTLFIIGRELKARVRANQNADISVMPS